MSKTIDKASLHLPSPSFLQFLVYGQIEKHQPFKYISENVVGLDNSIFLHKKYGTDIYTGIDLGIKFFTVNGERAEWSVDQSTPPHRASS